MARNTEKLEKWRNVHCGTWSVARNLKIMEYEKNTL
jgi:hypothetical protein